MDKQLQNDEFFIHQLEHKYASLQFEKLDSFSIKKTMYEINTQGRIISISIVNYDFEEFPEEIFLFKNLIKLNIFGANFLKGAKTKDYSLNNFDTIQLPEKIGSLVNLEELYLANNIITSLPESFGRLSNLKILNLAQNGFNNFPKTFSNLTNLEYLDISFNNFSEYTLPLDILQKLPKLQILKLSASELFRVIPEEIGSLSNLVELHVDFCNLNNLPISLDKLSKLTVLKANNNNITSLKQSLYKLTELKILKLENNKIEYLSNEICHLSKLEVFSIAKNSLKDIPICIFDLPLLKEIYFNHNPLLKEKISMQLKLKFKELKKKEIKFDYF